MQEAHAGRLFDHVGIHVRDVEAGRAFYAAVLEPLGLRVTATGDGGFSADEFFVSGGRTPTAGLHLAFQADSPEVVDRFHAAALAAGAIDNGAPGERAYHPGLLRRVRSRPGRQQRRGRLSWARRAVGAVGRPSLVAHGMVCQASRSDDDAPSREVYAKSLGSSEYRSASKRRPS
jgi:catechol 2,3-dioxygenase-like lactoylglutathione lyase family enzyme